MIDYTINTIPKYTRSGTARLWMGHLLTLMYQLGLIEHNTYIITYNEATKFLGDGTTP